MPASPPPRAATRTSGRFTFVARTLRGLEAIAAEEIAETFTPLTSAPTLGHREVRFGVAGIPPSLLRLGTVDDVLLVLADGPPPSRRGEAAAAAVRLLADALDETALGALLAARSLLSARPAFDVTATSVGVRTAGRFALEDAVGAALARRLGWPYRSRSGGRRPADTALSFRLHATAAGCLLAVRVAPRPLHRRAYRPPAATRAGALHPPLARALAVLARPALGERLLDPMCGTGTIPIEAALADPRVTTTGCDIRPESIGVARGAARRAPAVRTRFMTADAAALPLDAASVHAVAVNPPWGRAVAALGRLADGYAPLVTQLLRVLVPDGRIVVLEPAGGPLVAALRAGGFGPRRATWVRVAGALADVVVARRPA